jgi:hypothetical protein
VAVGEGASEGGRARRFVCDLVPLFFLLVRESENRTTGHF